MNLGELKIKLLLDGVRVESGVYEHNDEFLNKRYYYGKSDKCTVINRPPQEILLSRYGTVTGVTLNHNSPWLLKKDCEKYFLYKDEECIQQIFITKKPNYYDMLVNNKRCSQILGIYGSFILSAFVRGFCDFFIHNEQCKFCSLNPTRKSKDNDGDLFLQENDVLEATRLSLQYDGNRIACIMLCGGSWFNRDEEVRNYCKIVKAIQKINLGNRRVHVLMSPPKKLDQFKALKEAGVNSIGMSLEVYDKSLFPFICPGKSKHIGYERFIEAYSEAVSVFGKGNVYSVFVGGLESNDTLMSGMKHMCEIGVVPSINIFHPNPNSYFENKSAPEFNEVLEFSHYQSELFDKYNYLPAVFGFNRSSVDGESYSGFFSSQKAGNLKSPLYNIDSNELL